jgi:hypothetical protein
MPSAQQRLATTRRNRGLAIAYQAEESEIAAATWEMLLARQSQPDFTNEEASSLRQLQRWKREGGPRPLLPERVEALGRRLVTQRMKGERGELPRTRRLSRTDRRRYRTGYAPSFSTQLGPGLLQETDPFKLQRLVHELRREARNLGLLPAHRGCAQPQGHPRRASWPINLTASGRKRIRAAHGQHREAQEARVLRACCELAHDDPRRTAREERFQELALKQERRAQFLLALTETEAT